MKLLSFVVLLTLAFGAAAKPLPSLDLTDATARGAVAITARAQSLGPNNLRCTLANLTNQEIRLRVPPGLHFGAGDAGEQDLFTFQEKLLVLAPRAHTSIALWGFCMEQHDHAPGADAVYNFRGLADRGLQPLGDSLQKYPALADGYGQMFVWAITDQGDVADIRVAPALLRGATNVLHYLARVTGRATGTARSSLDHRPSVRTFSKRVFITYHSPVSQVTALKVFGADGEERYTVAPHWTLSPGVMRYSITLNEIVGIDAQPSYSVRLMSPTGQVLQDTKVTDATPEVDVAPVEQEVAFVFSLDKPVRNVYLRMRLPDGTLVEELRKLPFLPAGNHRYTWTFYHTQPAGTPFVARLETAAGKLLHEQAAPASAAPQGRKR
jgi:hypothetical protein